MANICETIKICGLDRSEIERRLEKFVGFGVEFQVEEDCLDASVKMELSWIIYA